MIAINQVTVSDLLQDTNHNKDGHKTKENRQPPISMDAPLNDEGGWG